MFEFLKIFGKSKSISAQDCDFCGIKYRDVENPDTEKLLANQDEVSLEFLIEDKVVEVMTFDNGYLAWCYGEHWKDLNAIKFVNYSYRILNSDKKNE